VASVASVVTYPVLLALGLPPLSANVTNTMSLVLTGAGSVLGSRPELAGQRCRVLRLGALTAAGGVAGAAVLLLAPPSAFGFVVPVLIGGASLLLLAQPLIRGLSPRPGAERSPWRLAVMVAAFAPVHWVFVPPLAAGFLVGGFTGPRLVRRLPVRALRVFVALCGLALAAKLGAAAYR